MVGWRDGKFAVRPMCWGGGTATAYATGKRDTVLPSETRLSLTLKQPLTIVRRT
jgi:hypothetical protein